MWPNFLIIGAMKAGTTSLYEYLRAHPDVFMPTMKSPNFFMNDTSPGRRPDKPTTEDAYRHLFTPARGAFAVGEASTGYSKWPTFDGVPERIADAIPDIRLIYLVRHPIERIRSQYLHWRLKQPMPSIEEAVLNDPRYVQFSSYATQLERYLEHFSRSQILVLKSEDLLRQRDVTLKRVLTFLEIDPNLPASVQSETFHVSRERIPTRPTFDRLRRSPAFRAMTAPIPATWKAAVDRRTRLLRAPVPADLSPATVATLESRLKPEVTRLRSYLDEPFDGWGIA